MADEQQCPECGETTVGVPCDECKFATCMACGYPCACPDVEEAYATARAENDFAAGRKTAEGNDGR